MSNKNKLIIFQNPDKDNYEKIDYNKVHLLPSPIRMILCSTPSCGKTNMILNIIHAQTKEYDFIYLLHLDEDTEEYDFFDIIKLNEIPDKNFFKKNKNDKKLLIIEEMSFKKLSKDDAQNIDHLFKYVSSHYNLSIIISCQVYYNLPFDIRKKCNYISIWNSSDSVLLRSLKDVIPYYSNDFYKQIIHKELKTQYDNLILCKNDKYIIKNLYDKLDI